MKNRTKYLLICSAVFLESSLVVAQNGGTSLTSNNIDLKILDFKPITCGLTVSGRETRKNPTLFCLDAPKLETTKIDPSFFVIVKQWLASHPDAVVTEILKQPSYPTGRSEDGLEAYVWVVDNGEVLNIKLVESGACEARTMILDPDDEQNILIDRSKYEQFKRRVKEAETLAKEHRAGIWK